MELNISVVAGMRIVSLSPHPTMFWTGEEVGPCSKELVQFFTLKNESEKIGQKGLFSLITFKKVLEEEGKSVLSEILSRKDVDFVLVPALFSTLVDQFADLPKGKMVAYNATPETQRSRPSEKVASDQFTLIW
ncbi:hypothetical protein K9M42_00960 [Patescibacteria group bacterium]|nr:hypothetical protein [Patescibacteria group bacterium]